MLYRRLSAARGPTVRTVLANNYPLYLATSSTNTTITLSSTLSNATSLRVGINRATTVKVNVQAPGSGGGGGSATSSTCYSSQPFGNMPAANGANGTAGFFWTANISRALLNTGVITIGARGLGANAGGAVSINGGRGGQNEQPAGLGGTVGQGVLVNFSNTVFTLPSNGAGGGGGGTSRRGDGRSGNSPTTGNAGSLGSIGASFTLGDSGSGGNSGSNSRGGFTRGPCYGNPSPSYIPLYPGQVNGTGVTSRGTSNLHNIGTAIGPPVGSPINIPIHGVTVFTANEFGKGGLSGIRAPTASDWTAAPAANTINHGSNGAFMISPIRSTFRF